MPELGFWEEGLRKLGFGKNDVATTNRLRSLCDEEFGNVQELRAILLAFAGDDMPSTAFFDKKGRPLSFSEVCQEAHEKIRQIRANSKEQRNFFRLLFVTVPKWLKAKTFAAATLAIPLMTIFKNYYSKIFEKDNIEMPSKKEMALAFVKAGAFLLAFTLVDDQLSGKLRNAVNRKMKQDIESWSATVESSDKVLKNSIHADIRNACANGQDATIRDVRLHIMHHHPTTTARVLVHPDGRLLTEAEICKAMAVFT